MAFSTRCSRSISCSSPASCCSHLASGHGVFADPVDLGHQPLDQQVGLHERYHRDQADQRGRGRLRWSRPFDSELFTAPPPRMTGFVRDEA
jgi:hypothetical protein